MCLLLLLNLGCCTSRQCMASASSSSELRPSVYAQVAAVFEWLTDCLRDPGGTYDLITPARRPLVTSLGTIRSADLLPSVRKVHLLAGSILLVAMTGAIVSTNKLVYYFRKLRRYKTISFNLSWSCYVRGAKVGVVVARSCRWLQSTMHHVHSLNMPPCWCCLTLEVSIVADGSVIPT